jgi:lysophospholipase L1-like esterase
VIARELAAASGRPVLLTNTAGVGAQSKDLAAQVDRILAVRPNVAVIMIGANDITHRVRPQLSVRLLGEAVARLREAGCEVVVGTCPDLGTVQPLAVPLRQYARRMSRELAAAQRLATLEHGGRPVQLGEELAGLFDSEPEVYFSADRFHPSAAGYVACAHALLPEVLAALDIPSPGDVPALPSA